MEMKTLLLVGTLLFCGIWLLIYTYLIYASKHLPRFHRFDIHAPDKWPRLSIIVPACNEAEHIEAAVKTLLAQEYPDLEIILIDDRSTDNTGKIISRLAANDPRIKPVQISFLPEGWLGKVHALHQGMQQATGEWLLITDADIYYANGTLKRAIAYSIQENIDHLALMPDVKLHNYWLEVAISTFGLMFLLTTRATQINNPDSSAFIGIGAFNLVKRETFDKTPGFEWLRLEVVDDVGVGYMIKKAGGKIRFALADKDLSLSWYKSISAMFGGLEKNLFGAGASYSWWKSIVQVLLLWQLLVAPFVALSSSIPVMFNTGLVVIAVHVLFSIVCVRDKQSETLRLLMFPVGMLILSLMILWSAFQCIKNGGINWRGTHYSLVELRKGQRVRL